MAPSTIHTVSSSSPKSIMDHYHSAILKLGSPPIMDASWLPSPLVGSYLILQPGKLQESQGLPCEHFQLLGSDALFSRKQPFVHVVLQSSPKHYTL